ncbi:MAG TPA: glycoside hydrolase family 3 N-terminal domain-containing protein [Gemmatimonadales bacterium]
MTAGRLVIPALRWSNETGFSHEEPLIASALEFGAGGFILFGGTADAVRTLAARLRREAGRPILVAADLERGAGQQVAGLAELPPPLALESLGEPAVIRGAGLLTAAEALSVGVNWVLAPVADLDLEPDNPIVQTRSFGADPDRTAAAVANWIAGCEAGGALACAKHFPGHGRTRVDSHDALPVVEASAAVLRATDLVPFRAAVQAGVSSVMTSHVAYPALDPSGLPATLSAPIVAMLRHQLGFEGLIVTDAMMMEGSRGGRTPVQAAVDALVAGVDLLLYPDDPVAVAEALSRMAQQGGAGGRRIEEALDRVERAARRGEANLLPDVEIHAGSSEALGDWLVARPLAHGELGPISAPLELVTIDDDAGQRYPPSSPTTAVAEALTALGVPLGEGGSRVVLAFGEPRASKGRAGFGPATRQRLAETARDAALVVVFGHPRLAAAVPAGPPVLVAWHRQRLMQRAVARFLAERLA